MARGSNKPAKLKDDFLRSLLREDPDAAKVIRALRASAGPKALKEERKKSDQRNYDLYAPLLKTMTINGIANVIRSSWNQMDPKGINFAAKPYLEAMGGLTSVKDNYGSDSGKEILVYFLGNASGWKGEMAKAVKAELKARIKGTELPKEELYLSGNNPRLAPGVFTMRDDAQPLRFPKGLEKAPTITLKLLGYTGEQIKEMRKNERNRSTVSTTVSTKKYETDTSDKDDPRRVFRSGPDRRDDFKGIPGQY